MKIQFSDRIEKAFDAGVLCAFEDTGLTPQGQQIDQDGNRCISNFISQMAFKAEKNETLTLAPVQGTIATHLIIIGAGKRADLTEKLAWELGGHIYTALEKTKQKKICLLLDDLEAAWVAALISGLQLRSWKFDKYKTKQEEKEKPKIETIHVFCTHPQEAQDIFKDLNTVIEGSFLTRTLVCEPSNVIYPETLAEQAQVLSKFGVQVDVFNEAQLKDMGMHALLGVGAGSTKESKLVVMQWVGAKDKTEQPVAFVGKGITFDSGGISIKPSKGMEEMKWDMGGAAVVVGLMKTLAMRHAKVNVIGTIALAENMPSGSAQRPGDIVKSYSGQTIEILNTDAEGRLVLADALWYTQEKYKPKFMIDLATLTGAIIISLGHEYAGLFSNDETLMQQIKQASQDTGEKVWPMPLDEVFDKDIDSPVADVKNIGSYGAGSITAAQFLQRFVNKTPWAHLDIAGVVWSEKDRPLSEKGATSFGIRLLDRLLRNHYETKE